MSNKISSDSTPVSKPNLPETQTEFAESEKVIGSVRQPNIARDIFEAPAGAVKKAIDAMPPQQTELETLKRQREIQSLFPQGPAFQETSQDVLAAANDVAANKERSTSSLPEGIVATPAGAAALAQEGIGQKEKAD